MCVGSTMVRMDTLLNQVKKSFIIRAKSYLSFSLKARIIRAKSYLLIIFAEGPFFSVKWAIFQIE